MSHRRLAELRPRTAERARRARRWVRRRLSRWQYAGICAAFGVVFWGLSLALLGAWSNGRAIDVDNLWQNIVAAAISGMAAGAAIRPGLDQGHGQRLLLTLAMIWLGTIAFLVCLALMGIASGRADFVDEAIGVALFLSLFLLPMLVFSFALPLFPIAWLMLECLALIDCEEICSKREQRRKRA